MVVKTNVSEKQIEEISLALGVKIHSYQEILEGTENSNFFVETNKGKKVLTIFEDRIKEDGIMFACELQNFLSDNGLKTARCEMLPKKIASLDKFCGIFDFLSGRPKDFYDIELEDLIEIGKTLAKFHNVSKDFSMVLKNEFFESYICDYLRDKNYEFFQIAKGTFNKVTEFEKFLPSGAIHADLFLDNILCDGDCLSLIDFYFSCTGFLAYDLAMFCMVSCFDFDGKILYDRFGATLFGYNSIRKIEMSERSLFVEFLTIAILRFFCSRMQSLEWKRKTRHPDDMRFRLEFLLANSKNVMDIVLNV